MAEWQKNDNLKRVRDEAWLLKLPAVERKEWLKLWSDIQTLATSDPGERAKQARAFIREQAMGRGGRTLQQASQGYAEAEQRSLVRVRGRAITVWRSRRLSADLQTHARTGCQADRNAALSGGPRLHAWPPSRLKIRKACHKSAPEELQRTSKFFWSLTEQGALQYRADNYEQAVALFEKASERTQNPVTRS